MEMNPTKKIAVTIKNKDGTILPNGSFTLSKTNRCDMINKKISLMDFTRPSNCNKIK